MPARREPRLATPKQVLQARQRARRRVQGRITDAQWQARAYMGEPDVLADPAAFAYWREQARLWKRALAIIRKRSAR